MADKLKNAWMQMYLSLLVLTMSSYERSRRLVRSSRSLKVVPEENSLDT